MRVILDASRLDHLTVAQGQFRYLVDLLWGLHALAEPSEFLVLGSRRKPPADIVGLFASPDWRYRAVPRWQFRGGAYLDYLRYAFLLRQAHADVFHALHTFVPIASPCPVAVTIFDLIYERFPEYATALRSRPYRLYRWAVRHTVQQAICISQATAQDVASRWGIDPSRIAAIPLGTEVARWRNLAAQPNGRIDHLTSTGPTLTSVYNLEPRKNLDGLLRAIASLRWEFPDLRLILFGQAAVTPQRERSFRALLDQLDLASTVVQCGILDDGSLARLYATGTAFVYPSRWEGFGLPILEAMACGACVVASRTPVVAEILGDAGVAVDTEDSDRFTRSLSELLRDPARQQALRHAAAVRAQIFTRERMARATYEVYRSLAAGRVLR
jgi:glycosyltransferase involved in cell wall biosynthesis